MNQKLQEKISEEFWLKYLSGIDVHAILHELNVAPSKEDKSKEYSLKLDEKDAVLWQKATGLKSLNEYLLLSAAYALVFFRYTSHQSLLLALPSPIVNGALFYLHLNLNSDCTLKELLNNIKQELSKGYNYHTYNQQLLTEKLNSTYPHKAYLHHTIGLKNTSDHQSGLDVSLINSEITITVNDTIDNALGQTCVDHFRKAINFILTSKGATIGDFDVLSDEDLAHLKEIAFKKSNSHNYNGILDLLNEFAKSTPNAPALISDIKNYSYKQLNDLTIQIANLITIHKNTENEHIAIISSTSNFSVLCSIGIMKAHCAYVPIDPKFPIKRINEIIEQAQCNIAFIDSENEDLKAALNIEHIFNEKDWANQSVEQSSTTLPNPNSTAYVLFTSGSTGKPKGVAIPHISLVNRLLGDAEHYRHISNFRSIVLANMTFDISVLEIFQAISVGGSFVIPNHNNLLDYHYIRSQIKQHEVNYIVATPSYLYGLLLPKNKWEEAAGNSVKIIISGGESLKADLVKKVKAKTGIYINNHYGPTEITINATAHKTSGNYKANIIGKPLPGVHLKVLNSQLQYVPIGIVGELFIGGNILASSYLNNPEATTQSFIKDPYDPQHTLYKTGDLVRWTRENTIEFIGRKDLQVKLNGLRIELKEIENVVLNHKHVKAIHLSIKNINKTDALCAYIQWDNKIDISEIENHLKAYLPKYMLPNYWVEMDHFPLNTAGKINEAKLPLPKNISTLKLTPASSPTEKKLFTIWSEILGHTNFGTKNSFFTIGGHSLRVAKMAGRIYEEFGVQVSIQDLFKYPFINSISELIKSNHPEKIKSIQVAPELEYYPVSYAQRRIYMLQAMEPEATHYNMPMLFKLNKKYSIDTLENVFQCLLDQHESLRTSFHSKNEAIVQQIHHNIKVNFTVAKRQNIETLKNSFIAPFDLSNPSLFRVSITETKDNHYLLGIDMHHIISDAVSMEILMHDVELLLEGKKLNKNALEYKDFAYWQQNEFDGKLFKSQKEFWLKTYQNIPETLTLPYDYSRPEQRNFEGNSIVTTLEKDLSDDIKQYCQNNNITPYVLLLATYGMLLSKYSGQETLVIGTPVAGRNHYNLEGIVGMFVNTLPLLLKPLATKKSIDFIHEIKNHVLEGLENQNYPFEMLLDELNLDRDLSRNPLFDVFFALQNNDNLSPTASDIENIPFENRVAKFDLTLECIQNQSHITLNLEYNTKLFSNEKAMQMAQHYIQLLKDVLKNDRKCISQLSCLNEEEQLRLSEHFSQKTKAFLPYNTILELLSPNIKNGDLAPAITEANTTTISYHQLNNYSNAMANALVNYDVQAGDRIVICSEASINWAIAILACLKCGCTFIPVDVNYPDERIKYILKDASPKVIISSKPDVPVLLETHIPVLNAKNLEESTSFRPLKCSSHDIAYIIYTSGTTGKPKGVKISHESIVDRIQCFKDYFKLNAQDKILQFASIAFDASIFEIFVALHCQAELIIANEKEKISSDNFIDVLTRYQISHVTLSPSYLKTIELFKLPKGLKQIISAGERFDVNVLKSIPAHIELYNGYGPTENTIASTYYKLNNTETGSNIPIGKPIANCSILILDKNQNLCPIGVTGELYLGGKGLSTGYLNNESLTQQKFISLTNYGSNKYYKSGDLGYWNQAGNIIFQGRIDEQVQIRGVRLELGEIENALNQYSGVESSVAILYTDDENESNLAVFFTSNKYIKADDILSHLSQKLPRYAVPSFVQQLNKIPITTNGKIDTKQLQGKINNQQNKTIEKAKTNTEKALIELWTIVLGNKVVGRNSHFFELGGQSLKAMRLLSLIEQKWGLNLTLKLIFQNPTVHQLAHKIDTESKQTLPSFTALETKSHYALSPSQQRLFVLQQLNPNSTAYNMPNATYLIGKLDIEKLQNALNKLCARHEILRSNFKMLDAKARLIVNEKQAVSLKKSKLNQFDYSIISDLIKPFDLSKDALLRVHLFEIESKKHILFLDMHHIISDAVSMQLLVEELLLHYQENKELPPLKYQYKDYAHYLEQLKTNGFIKKQEEYWQNVFSSVPPVLDLPIDFKRPEHQSFDGKVFEASIPETISKQIHTYCEKNELTLNAFFFSLYALWLSKLSDQDNIVIGTPVSGRKNEHTQKMLGMFINTLAIRTTIDAKQTFTDYAKGVRKILIDALDHQDLPFEELLDMVNVPRDLSRNPLFDVLFSFFNKSEDKIATHDLKVEALKIEGASSKFDINFEVVENEHNFNIILQYATSLFKPKSIKQFTEYFNNILHQAIENPSRKLASISLINSNSIDPISNLLPNYSYQSIVEIFEATQSKFNFHLALKDASSSCTYNEANAKINKIARYLINEKQIKKGDAIAVFESRSAQLPLLILGILKSGAVYVPINKNNPDNRIVTIIKNAKVKCIIGSDEGISKFGIENIKPQLCFDYNGTRVQFPELNKNDAAYIMHTSGSTGVPKGVKVSHGNMALFHLFLTNELKVTSEDKFIALTDIGFDISILELIYPLLFGANIYVASERQIEILKDTTALIKNENITTLQATPSRIQVLLDTDDITKYTSLKTLLIGGELISEQLFNRLKQATNKNIYNVYGPTESCIWSTFKSIHLAQTNTNIGKALPGEKIIILNQNLQLLPNGITGEICITGASVAMGYENLDLKLNSPFIENITLSKYPIYKTGDRGYINTSGDLIYKGRNDHQLKIRGYRIELQEIENQLSKLSTIKNQAVVYNQKLDDMVCFYSAQKELDVKNIKTYLNKYLPTYMIPSYYVHKLVLPSNSNGKIDRTKLASENPVLKQHSSIEKLSIHEITMANYWHAVGCLKPQSSNDNFFECGGNSIRLIQLLNFIQKDTNTDIPLQKVFEDSTLLGMSDLLKATKTGSEKEYIVYNSNATQQVFLFPPASGMGYAYRALALEIPNIQFICFHFPNHQEPIAQIVKHIKTLSRSDMVILGGYSVGGNLAYQVNIALTKAHISVDKLILIDAYRRVTIPEKDEKSKSELNTMLKDLRQINSQSIQSTKNTESLLEKRIKSYYEFIHDGPDDIFSESTAILIKSTENQDSPSRSRQAWNNLFTNFKECEGKGSHIEMLFENNVKSNAHLFESLLAKNSLKNPNLTL